MQDGVTWLTAVTQLGSVICKSFRPVDLTTGRTGFLVSQWSFFNVSEFRWCPISYILYIFFSQVLKDYSYLVQSTSKKNFALEWAGIV